MHFEFTVTLGQVGLFVALIALIWRVEVFTTWFLIEHEMLIKWYCDEHSIEDPGELLSRRIRYGLLSVFRGHVRNEE